MSAVNSWRTRLVLFIGHVAGMVDMVALPVWVGTLMQHYRYNAQQAGGLVTLFLVGAVSASAFFASRFGRMPGRWMPTVGFAVTALSFCGATQVTGFLPLGALHLAGGLGVGCGLSFVHGAMGCSANPHRLFASAQFALGVFAALFLGIVPRFMASADGTRLFLIFAVLMAIAVIATGMAFPRISAPPAQAASAASYTQISRSAWYAIVGVLLLSLNQAMMFSFVQRIGIAHSFGLERVNGVLVLVGFINLLPAILAALLQHRLTPRKVAIAAPLVQAALALVISNTSSFEPYAAAASVYVSVMIFTHTFLFALIAQLDPSGRAVAATPAMVMTGSAIGPFLGGTAALHFGFPAIGAAVALIAVVAAICFARIGKQAQTAVGVLVSRRM